MAKMQQTSTIMMTGKLVLLLLLLAGPVSAFPNALRIVGGEPTTNSNYSFFVTNTALGCGGTLVHDDMVLTAAHCVNLGGFGKGNMVVGLFKYSDMGKATKYKAVRSIPHPQYQESNNKNDIALMKLDKPVTGITPVVWANSSSLPVKDTPATVMGYGVVKNFPGYTSDVLRKVTFKTVGDDICEMQYGTQAFFRDEMFCAGALNKAGKDACQGDSGGPLVDDATNVQYGVVSFGRGCAQHNFVGVYARVGNYDSFIRDTICTCSANKPSYCDSSKYAGKTIDDCGKPFKVSRESDPSKLFLPEHKSTF